MALHPMALAHARGLPSDEALHLALLDSPAKLSLVGGEPGDADARALWEACRAYTYLCRSCGESKPVSAWSRDSASVGLCNACLDEAETENAHADGYHAEEPEPDPDCPACKEETA